MLTVVSGPYHPDLENAFLDRVSELKSEPFARLLVVTPSNRLRERLLIQLASRAPALLNVEFHTFFSLARQILAAAGGPDIPLITDPPFYDQLARQIQKEDRPFGGYEDLAVPNGFPIAVKATLQDLVDAGVDEKQAEEAIAEEYLGHEVDRGKLRQLLQFYRIYLQRLEKMKILSRADVVSRATEVAPASAYLSEFREILYYGFYDLTGLQSEFFQAVVRHFPARFFFPYVHDHPAYAFARRFRDNVLQTIRFDEVRLAEGPADRVRAESRALSVSGLTDEAWAIAREALRAHQAGVPFEDMAVVFRGKDRISDGFVAALRSHGIPVRRSAPPSAGGSPLLEAVLSLLRAIVRPPAPGDPLDFRLHPDFRAEKREGDFSSPPGWPLDAEWSVFVRKTRETIGEFFAPESPASAEFLDRLLRDAGRMGDYAKISKRVTLRDFMDALEERWTRLDLPDPLSGSAGLSVLFAESARGLSFRIVFLAGAEERVFPRLVREDPFLRDDARRALNMVVGNRVPEKMTALEEERLLFNVICESAAGKLFFVFQRSDDEGAVVGPSPFLRAFFEERGRSLEAETTVIPRPFLSKARQDAPDTLSAAAIVARLLAAGVRRAAVDVIRGLSPDGDSFATSLEFSDALQKKGVAGPADGVVGEAAAAAALSNPLSPSTLETLGECPFKYFAVRLLRLEPLEDQTSPERLEPTLEGKLVHLFLERFYRKVTAEGTTQPPSVLPEEAFDEIFRDVFENPAGVEVDGETVNVHPLLWEALKTGIRAELEAFVAADLRECAESGYRPRFFEKQVSFALDEPLAAAKWKGIMDRIDVSDRGARVVDYKTGRFALSSRAATLALRGRKVQPPLYLLLLEKMLADAKAPADQLEFVYKRVRPNDTSRDTLSASEWEVNRSDFVRTLETQIGLIRRGLFTIFPDDDYCGRCEVSSICRFTHRPTRFRALGGAGNVLKEMRVKKALPGKKPAREKT